MVQVCEWCRYASGAGVCVLEHFPDKFQCGLAVCVVSGFGNGTNTCACV